MARCVGVCPLTDMVQCKTTGIIISSRSWHFKLSRQEGRATRSWTCVAGLGEGIKMGKPDARRWPEGSVGSVGSTFPKYLVSHLS